MQACCGLSVLASVLACVPAMAGTAQLTYDALYRLTHVDYGNGTTIAYTYDAAGNRLSLVGQAGSSPDRAAPVIQITQPTTERLHVTTASSITLAGTANDATGVAALSYTNDTGAQGSVAGTTSWTAGPIALSNGLNRLTISASDPAGNVGRASLVVVALPPDGGTNVVFQDDFNDNTIAVGTWTNTGNVVQETDQMMKVLTTVTDAGGLLVSRPFPINRAGLITITRKVRLHYSNNTFVGYFKVTPGSLGAFGVHYANMEWNSPQNDASSCYGFYLGRYGQGPHTGPNRAVDTTGPVLGVWDTWFQEKLTYDPVTGQLDYWINDTNRMTYAVGALPADGPATLALDVSAWGWWTGHEQLFDNLVITQEQATGSLLTRDTDGDGIPDWAEIVAGTRMDDRDSMLRMHAANPGHLGPESVTIEWESVPGVYYNVGRATNLLVTPSFIPIQTRIPGLPDKTTYTDTNVPSMGALFYRITVDY